MDGGNKHGASAALTGYLFQCRCALLKGLQAIPNSPELAISIEKFDDIAFEAGEPIELIQTKHHISKKGSLSDSSVDLWENSVDMVEFSSERCRSAVSSIFCATNYSRRSKWISRFLPAFAR